MAIANQGRTIAKAGLLKNAVADLYAQPQTAFRDISSGYSCYPALAGYDLPTGLGVPQANQLYPGPGKAKETKLSVPGKASPAAAEPATPLAKPQVAAAATPAQYSSDELGAICSLPTLTTRRLIPSPASPPTGRFPTLGSTPSFGQFNNGIVDYVGIDGVSDVSADTVWIGTVSTYGATASQPGQQPVVHRRGRNVLGWLAHNGQGQRFHERFGHLPEHQARLRLL